MTFVRTFNINSLPDHHRRPCIAEFMDSGGKLAIHCDRDDGSLWLFATGPRGGDRGKIAFALSRAGFVRAWCQQGCVGAIYGARHWVNINVDHVEIHPHGRAERWKLTLSPDARAELVLAIRSWAEAAERLATTETEA